MADNMDEQQSPFDAYDPDRLAEAEKKANSLKSRKLRVVESIMASEDGRAWMHNVLGTECHTFSENQMRDTSERNGRFEGERGVGLRLFGQIMEASPEMFWSMMKEAQERQQS